MKIVKINKRGYGRYNVIIDELGVVLKDMSDMQIHILKATQNTKYFVPLIETIINNPNFSLEEFYKKMELEDLVSEKPSKILVSAQDDVEKYYVDRNGTTAFCTHSRILTREQADILKQCLALNSKFNFFGPNNANHGFDIETFGIEFISKLDNGLDEYTYEVLLEDEELLNELKHNPQVATYVAKAVNEYNKILYDMENNTSFFELQDLESWNDPQLDEIEGSSFFDKKAEMRKRLKAQGKLFNKFNGVDEDQEDLETLFRQRIQQLSHMSREQIKMFEEYEDYRFNMYPYKLWAKEENPELIKRHRGKVTINPETLVEGSAMEYLKTSGPRIDVADTDKAFVKKALKTANDLVIKQDEHGKDITYLQSMLQQRIEGPTNAGSSYENVTERELLENLLNADWEETSHPDVMEGCRVFKCNLPGLEGILNLDELDENTELYAIDPKGTGNIGIGAGNVTKKMAQETYLITGKEVIDGIEKDIVFTFHPGEPVKPSQVKAEKVADGTKLTVAKARKLGLDKAKYLSDDMLQMYREKYEKEKPFFKKFLDKVKGLFNRNKKLAPTSTESPSAHTSQESTKKDFAEAIKVAERELQQNDEVIKTQSIKSQGQEK